MTIIEKLTYINSEIKDIKKDLSSYNVVEYPVTLSSIRNGLSTLNDKYEKEAKAVETLSSELSTAQQDYAAISNLYDTLSGEYDTLSGEYASLSTEYQQIETIVNAILT